MTVAGPPTETWGYTDRFSVGSGDRLQVMVSSTAAELSASMVRLGRLNFARGVTHVARSVEGLGRRRVLAGRHPIASGSYASVPLAGAEIDVGSGFTLSSWVCPTLVGPGTNWVMRAGAEPAGADLGLGIAPGAGVLLCVGGTRLCSEVELVTGEWCFIAAAFDPRRRLAKVLQLPARRWPGYPGASVEASFEWDVARLTSELRIGAGRDASAGGYAPAGVFNGKVDEPSVFTRPLAEEELSRLAAGADPVTFAGAAGVWSFLPTQPSGTATDRSPARRNGRLVNLPTTAVTGRRWRGARTSWQAAPEQYSAVAFHNDDLEDAGWPVAAELEIPDRLSSGIYAVRLAGDDGSLDEVPFFVRPRAPGGEVLFLAPTFTYLAYANEHWTWCNPAVELPFDASEGLTDADRYAATNRLLSLYDHHGDDSGVSLASRLRPLVTMRPGYVSALVRGRRELSADLFLTDWLETRGTRYDVATDGDLHAEGASLLGGYRVVITGSHPEYCSAQMLDALESYVDGGGRLMYLGGNGFYWVTTVDPSREHVIEVRRGHAGSGTWRSAPGEVDHSHTGEPGGLWRHRGRAPQRLVGVGMTAIGLGPGRPFMRTPGSYSPRLSWIFRGVGPEPIGERGHILGAAAGLEIDRADRDLGTPANAVVVATADGFDDRYQGVVEDVLESNSLQGGGVCPTVRADMTYHVTPGGGAVFSVGSITWAGALALNGYDNPAARVSSNVLDAFSAEAQLTDEGSDHGLGEAPVSPGGARAVSADERD